MTSPFYLNRPVNVCKNDSIQKASFLFVCSDNQTYALALKKKKGYKYKSEIFFSWDHLLLTKRADCIRSKCEDKCQALEVWNIKYMKGWDTSLFMAAKPSSALLTFVPAGLFVSFHITCTCAEYPVRRSLLGLLRKQKGSISILDSQSNGQEQRRQATLQFLEKKVFLFRRIYFYREAPHLQRSNEAADFISLLIIRPSHQLHFWYSRVDTLSPNGCERASCTTGTCVSQPFGSVQS